MKKSLLIICTLGLLFAGNISFSYTSNCEKVKELELKELPEGYKINLNNSLGKELLTEEGLLRAARNLKKYCCFDIKQLKGDKTCIKSNFDDIEDDYPKSPYFLDHVISVMARRLGPKSYTGVALDEKVAEWEKKLKEIKERTEGALPMEIDAIYKEYWMNSKCRDTNARGKFQVLTPKYSISEYDGTSSTTYIHQIEKKEEGANINNIDKFKDIKDWDITTRYLNLCQTAIYLTMKQNIYDATDQETLIFQRKCLDNINKALNKKVNFYSNIITTQANLLMQKSLTDYNNFLQVRNESLSTNAGRANNLLAGVMRMTQQVTLKCN